MDRRFLLRKILPIFLVSAPTFSWMISCKQRTNSTNKIDVPVFKETPIMIPNPVDPAQVDQLKINFLQTLKKIQGESATVRNDRAIAKLLKQKHRDKTYIVKIRPEAVALTGGEHPDTPILAAGGEIKRRYELTTSLSVSFPNAGDDTHMIAVAKFLEDNIHVASVEPDILVKATAIPNDTRFSELWGLRNSGTSKIDIKATAAWDRTIGSRKIIVGIIDSGIDYNHPDLAPNIWINPGESGLDANGRDKRTNGIDDDGNKFVDDFRGWDFLYDDNDPMDENDHGTHVAGTIGAIGNNLTGVTGVNWEASLVPLRFLDRNSQGYISDAKAALEYAIKMKFFATNNSWGGGGYSETMLDTIRTARNAGQLFIAAAGNDATNIDSSAHYPASYEVENVISVAAVDRNGNLGWFSNYGAKTVHVAAPGVEILSTTRANTYSNFQGTSMAAPHVTGAAMLMKAMDPNLDYATIKTRLISTSTPLTGLTNRCVSGGIINVEAALGDPPDTTPPEAPKNIMISTRGLNSVELAWTPVNDANRTGGIKDYIIKTSDKAILTENDWASAKDPAAVTYAITSDKIKATLTLPIGSQLYTAVKSRDLSNNLSSISQSIQISTTPMTQLGTYKVDALKTLPTTTWVSENDPVRGPVFSDGVGKYASNTTRWLRLPSIPVRAQDKLVVRFWHRYEIEKGFDFARLTVESDDGLLPDTAAIYHGASNGWELVEMDLTPYLLFAQDSEKTTKITIGFRLTSDASVNYDGWYLDDISVLVLPSVFTADGIPDNPSIDKQASVKLSQTTEQELFKINKYAASLSAYSDGNSCQRILIPNQDITQPININTVLGRNRLCIKASLVDFSDTITRVYSWNRIAAPPPLAILTGLPSGFSNQRTIRATVSGTNVASYAVFSTNGDGTSCESGRYDVWIPVSTPISLSIDKEQKNLVCVKGKSDDGLIQTDISKAQWTSDFTPPNAVLTGQPPISSANNNSSIAVTAEGGESYTYATGSSLEDCKTYSPDVPLTAPIMLSITPNGDGPRSLCVKAKDAAGNTQTLPTVLSWTQDTVAQPIGFANLPNEISNSKTLDVSMIAPEHGSYRYKIFAGTVCDTTLLAKESPRELTQKISDTLPTADGAYTLCSTLIDTAGNVQDPPTTFSWTKDTAPPTSKLTGLPPAKSAQTTLNVTVSGDDVVSYRYALVTGTTNCAESAYGSTQPVAKPISTKITGIGIRTLCVKGIDTVGNIQTPATIYSWTQMTAPIIRPDLLRVPVSPNSRSLLNVGVSNPAGQKLVSYRYAFARGLPPSCARAQSWSASQSISRSITDNLGNFEGYKTLCVIAKNADGFEQLTPTEATWLRINGAQTSPSATIFATASLNKTATSLSVKISRSGTSVSQLPKQSLTTKLCRIEMSTGALDGASCTSLTANFNRGQKELNLPLPKMPSADYVFVVLPSSGRVEPLRFNY